MSRSTLRFIALLFTSLWLASAAAQTPSAESAPSPQPQQNETVVPAPAQSPQLAEPADRPQVIASGKTVSHGLQELSPWSMFLSAGLVVQAIMVGLTFASLVTWTVFVGKFMELFIAKRRLRIALRAVGRTRSLDEALNALPGDKSVMRAFIAAAINEARLSAGIDNETSIKERAASSFADIIRSESRRIRLGMGVLATIAATAPFVGLFGTVWGIMNSFIGISKSQTTNLAVVAPGIAEALLATAIGLFAAIPAVVIYNHFSRVTKGYLDLVNRAAGLAGRHLSRDLDRRQYVGGLRRAAE